jgi:hypothetical protein
MDLQTALNGVIPYNANSYAELAEIMENADIELSFWGGRNVYAVGYSDSIPLYDLVQKVIDLANSIPHYNVEAENLGMSAEEIRLGILIEGKISNFYDTSCQQVKDANFITKFFLEILAFFSYRESGDLSWKVIDSDSFSSAMHFSKFNKKKGV